MELAAIMKCQQQRLQWQMADITGIKAVPLLAERWGEREREMGGGYCILLSHRKSIDKAKRKQVAAPIAHCAGQINLRDADAAFRRFY